MKPVKFILSSFIAILIIPIFSLFILSLKATDGNGFKWYLEILKNDSFISAFLNSFITSIVIGCLTVLFSFFISLSYFDEKARVIVVFAVLIMGLMPADIISVSINKFAQIIGFNRANMFFLYFGLLLYCLPFGIIILWTRYYFIDRSLIIASRDLGLTNRSTVLKIILPLSKTSVVSVFLFAFLLSFNEYPRTFYLSGSVEFLSEFLNGKLSSGTDNSIYAGGSLSIVFSIGIIAAFGLYSHYLKKKGKKAI